MQSELPRRLANADEAESFIVRYGMYRPELEEIIRSPEWMLNDLATQGYMEGDCDDYATLLSSILTAMGISNRLIAVRTNMLNPEFDHVFVEIPGPWGTWERLDPTVFPHIPIPEAERLVVDVY
jgi:transglutaminase-like putative cysteine protease